MRSKMSDTRVRPDLRVCADLADLSRRAAEAAVGTINDAVRTAGKCSIVLSGGSTPRTLYSLLASRFRAQIPWAHVHVFWGDERYVPPEDPRSNYRMAKETLLDHVPCPPANIHPMPTHFPAAEAAARDYERTLRNHFVEEWPDFDLVLLGLGDDGHTASLFPGSLALAERTRWVVAAQAPVEPQLRLTLTLPALTRAGAVHVLVGGATKGEALRHVLEGAGDWIKYPAAGVRLGTGSVIWWADREAAALAHDRGDSR
jgi:6-phosphogluconolactonase